MYPLKSRNVSLGVHAPQFGNPWLRCFSFALLLFSLAHLKRTETKKELRPGRDMWSHMTSEEEFGTEYVKKKDDVRDPRKQILVPKSLRKRVMVVVHDSLFGVHLGVKKTEDRIQTNFFWPGCTRMLPVSVGLVMFAKRLSPEAQCHGHL